MIEKGITNRDNMTSGKESTEQSIIADNLPALLRERSLNLRQIFWRAHRGLNERIAKKCVERGYVGIRPAHISFLSNMSLGETDLIQLAERAQISVDGVKSIAQELERMGYIHVTGGPDVEPASANFSDKGWQLMLTTFNIVHEMEADYEERLGKGDLEQLRRMIGILFG